MGESFYFISNGKEKIRVLGCHVGCELVLFLFYFDFSLKKKNCQYFVSDFTVAINFFFKLVVPQNTRYRLHPTQGIPRRLAHLRRLR